MELALAAGRACTHACSSHDSCHGGAWQRGQQRPVIDVTNVVHGRAGGEHQRPRASGPSDGARWSPTMPVASKSPVLAGPHMCRAGRCFAPPASPVRSHVGAPYRAARSGSRGSRAWRTRVQGSGTTQAAELSKLAGAMACAHSAGMWHCSGSRQAGMNPWVHDSRCSDRTRCNLVHRGF